MTLVVHPGPPGDAGPSAIDWVLMGDDGEIEDTQDLLDSLNNDPVRPGRSHWGVTVLQAIEHFDAGPVWAFDQFPIDIDRCTITKASLYRGPITHAAVAATLAAITRLQLAQRFNSSSSISSKAYYSEDRLSTRLEAESRFRERSVTTNEPFGGGQLRHRPLLKAVARDFDLEKHTATQISRRIRCADSQPGVQSKVFGTALYLYGGIIESGTHGRQSSRLPHETAKVIGIRNEAVCLATKDGHGVWITHLRRLKGKSSALYPKVSAVSCLLELGLLSPEDVQTLQWPLADIWLRSPTAGTFQEIWVDFSQSDNRKTAYVHFDVYNGAMSTNICSRLVEALTHILVQSTAESPVEAVVLMGGSYFSNGIALNVIENAKDPALESWLNINRMNDVVQLLIQEFPSRGILTVAAMRGNAAAGGVALAAACDVVIAGSNIVLNPAYRTVGLHGSEYHSLSYVGRCGQSGARQLLRDMTPLSARQAQRMGLVDFVFPSGVLLDDYIYDHISWLLAPGCLKQGLWKGRLDFSSAAIANARASELGEMSKDFWSARSVRYHSRRAAFVRKITPAKTPSRYALHRRAAGRPCDEEETNQFDDLEYFEKIAEDQLLARVRKQLCDKLPASLAQDQLCDKLLVGVAQDGKGARSRKLMPPTPLDNPAFAEMGAQREASQALFSCYYESSEEVSMPRVCTPVTASVNDVFPSFGWSVASRQGA